MKALYSFLFTLLIMTSCGHSDYVPRVVKDIKTREVFALELHPLQPVGDTLVVVCRTPLMYEAGVHRVIIIQ